MEEIINTMEEVIKTLDEVVDLVNDLTEEVTTLKRDNQRLKEMIYLFCKRQTIPVQTLEGGQRKMVDNYCNEWRREWLEQMRGQPTADEIARVFGGKKDGD